MGEDRNHVSDLVDPRTWGWVPSSSGPSPTLHPLPFTPFQRQRDSYKPMGSSEVEGGPTCLFVWTNPEVHSYPNLLGAIFIVDL